MLLNQAQLVDLPIWIMTSSTASFAARCWAPGLAGFVLHCLSDVRIGQVDATWQVSL